MTAPVPPTPPHDLPSANGGTSDEFHAYLITEYKNVAEAHFRTIEAISSFFRYYLLIMSVPIGIFSAFIALSSDSNDLLSTIDDVEVVLGAALILVAIVGLSVQLYVVNLRMDVVLYARAVNAIRKHFYDQATIAIDEKLRTRVLPQTPSQPPYRELAYFIPVVSAFALFNTFYLVGGLTLLSGTSLKDFNWGSPPWWVWLGTGYGILHYLAYDLYARYREHAYLRSYSLGIDIDGVLNDHRAQFCRVLGDKTGTSRDPESLTTIPLHDDPALGITQEDERQVFNSPEYWTEMPALPEAAANVKRLRTAYRLKIEIFTHRPWPDSSLMDSDQASSLKREWKKAALDFTGAAHSGNWLSRVLLRLGIPFGTSPLEAITRAWLKAKGFEFDGLTVEKGNENVADPQAHFHNRFYVAREKKMRFFVEDDAEKAAKLAHICDVVFLLEQPYNANPRVTLPNNIIRCSTWDEIHRQIRTLS